MGDRAVVMGYPYGGPFTSVSAGVLGVSSAPVPNVYDTGAAPREVYSVAAEVRPGNSGGPLLTTDGQVAGVIFARADADVEVGFAMTNAELRPVAERAGGMDEAVSSGRCTAA